MEIRPESEYVKHHIQKIAGIFAAMRHFAEKLTDSGHNVKYFKISDGDNRHGFEDNLRFLAERHGIRRFEYLEPDEFRLDSLLGDMDLGVETEMFSTEHFFTARNEVAEFFGEKSMLMETFYRRMRQKHNILMDGNKPETGKWNYDHDNRKKLPKNHTVPEPLCFANDISDIVSEINKAKLHYFGHIDPDSFNWAVTREQALDILSYFFDNLFADFGRYQDALSESSWSVYHSRISQALNIKLISPREVVDGAIKSWREDQRVNIAQAEGFIRQILGWREYMRGIYWKYMPDFAEMNHFEHSRPLPGWYWDGNTQMRCLSKAIKQSLEHGYAHHIQRLMVTGNFALLAGIDPDELDKWYLGIYVDAFEWVEITNTRGMSQYADGGIVGSKPYVSSANYIHKMGDHCSNCHYDHKKKTGTGSCPFNSLYWNFLDRNRDKLENNPRMSMMYRVWDKNDDQSSILEQAEVYLNKIESL